MSADYLSVRTKNAVREVLARRKLHEISDLCSECGIGKSFSSSYRMGKGAQERLARECLETLELKYKKDAERLLALASRLGEESVEDEAFSALQKALQVDGFELFQSRLVAKSTFALVFFPGYAPANTITKDTRRKINDGLKQARLAVEGNLLFPAFLDRIITTPSMHTPLGVGLILTAINMSLSSLENPISGFGRPPIGWPDEAFLTVLVESLHPDVRGEREVSKLLALYNTHLEIDGWEIAKQAPAQEARPFLFRRRSASEIKIPELVHRTDALSDDYLREMSGKCDARLASADLEGAITAARTMLEAVLVELEKQLVGAPGDHKGDLPRQFKAVAKQLRFDDERADLDDNFKQVVRGLVQVVNGLAPIRNKMSDGHAREREPAPLHARFVVNAAKSVAMFLVESYLAQRERGLLAGQSNSLNSVEKTSGGVA